MRYVVNTITAIDSDNLADHINRLMAANGASRLHSCVFIRVTDDSHYEYLTIFEIQDKPKA